MSAVWAVSGSCRAVPLTKIVVSADSSRAAASLVASFGSKAGNEAALASDVVGEGMLPSYPSHGAATLNTTQHIIRQPCCC